MTRKQLRSLLEGFGVDPSFIIVRSEEDKGTIRCSSIDLKKKTADILKEHKIPMPHHTGYMNIYKNTKTIDFEIPKEYRPKKKPKTYLEILGEMEQVYCRPKMSRELHSDD